MSNQIRKQFEYCIWKLLYEYNFILFYEIKWEFSVYFIYSFQSNANIVLLENISILIYNILQ